MTLKKDPVPGRPQWAYGLVTPAEFGKMGAAADLKGFPSPHGALQEAYP